MYILRWLWEGFGYGEVAPSVVYWTLRVLMLTLSVVLEDWAIQELVQSRRARRDALLLVASSYVTWTFQTHTFSNSLETLLVSWSLVLIQRIVEDKVCARSESIPSLGHAANDPAEAFRRASFVAPGLPRCRWRLQPHYLSRLSARPFVQLVTALPAKVSTSLPPIRLD